MSRLLLVAAAWVCLSLTLTFLALPLVAIFLRIGPGELIAELGSDTALEALRVSFQTSLIAHVIILLAGTPAAYLLASRQFRGRSAVITLIELPLVVPPAAAGIGLLAAFGTNGLLGDSLAVAGLRIPFTTTAVVIAIVFVASPFYVRAGIAAFEGVDTGLRDAARTLGAGRWRVFWRVSLPLARAGLGAGSTLAFARGLGEFGATILFAGSLSGVTQTLSLAIYAEFDRDFDTALAISAFLITLSFAILLAAKIVPRWTRSASASTFPFATSGSR